MIDVPNSLSIGPVRINDAGQIVRSDTDTTSRIRLFSASPMGAEVDHATEDGEGSPTN